MGFSASCESFAEPKEGSSRATKEEYQYCQEFNVGKHQPWTKSHALN